MEKQNRAERRRNRFGGGRATEHGGWPTVRPNPVFGGEPPADEPPGASPQRKAPEAKSGPAKPAEGSEVGDSAEG